VRDLYIKPRFLSGWKILVGVANPPDAQVRVFEDALSAQPGSQIKTI
jgi:hypothetical protein